MKTQNGQTLTLPDGRQLGYTSIGKGKHIVYFHGTSSSRLEVNLLEKLAINYKLQLIVVDRPGYGLSTFKARRTLREFNDDINSLTQHLGFSRFGVLGWSGGGAFALAYTAFFPEHVTKAVVAAAPNLPFDASTAHNMPFARFAMKIPFLGYFAMKTMSRQILQANGDIDAFLKSSMGKQMLHGCSKSDLKFYSDPKWMALMYQSMVEGYRQGNESVKTVVGEHQLFLKPWNLPFTQIPEGKLVVWQGLEDKTCQVENAYLISKQVKASLEIFEGQGHCVLFENTEKLRKIFG